MIKRSNATALMTYTGKKNTVENQYLWIKSITQQNSLTGATYQSKFTRHFYPRYYSPGDYTVTCIGDSQDAMQDIAQYIRKFQEYIVNTDTKIGTNNTIKNQQNFVDLIIPSEQIHMVGVPSNIELNKKGVFDPVPFFSFNFILLYDLRRPTNFWVSSTINQYYNLTDTPGYNAYNNPNRNLPG